MKKVLLYGTGSSAKYFYENYTSEYQILEVIDKQTPRADFWQKPCLKPSQISRLDYEFIVIASWAIQNIFDELLVIGVARDKVLWFQHNKNKLVDQSEFANLILHEDVENQAILYAFYDLNVARTTFDITGFLCLAEVERKNCGADKVHVVIVNATNNEFNLAGKGIISTPEHDWRKRQLLMQSCALLPSCVGVTVTSCRSEAKVLLNRAEHVFPKNYSVDVPVARWEFTHLFEAVNEGHVCLHLRASEPAIAFLRSWYKSQGFDSPEQKVVTITLRWSEIKPKRNSNIEAWRDFAVYLRERGYFPVILPDTEDAWIDFPEGAIFTPACFNVELRMALYESAFLNTGVNNGPMHLCALNENTPYIMHKQITEDYAHTSTKSFIDRGFVIGQDFPGATKLQKLVWEDDSYEVIKTSFEQLERDLYESKNRTNEQ